MNYWLVRANWGGDDKTAQFIQENRWINGYDDKYLDIVNRVKEGDILLFANGSLINYYGICKQNRKDGQVIDVKEWIKFKEPIYFLGKGAYIRAIVNIKDNSLLKLAKEKISSLKEKNQLKLIELSLENFTLFKNLKLNFSSGINIFIGENGTGKTHILKAIYSTIQANNSLSKKPTITETNLAESIFYELNETFRSKQVKDLRSFDTDRANIKIDLSEYIINFSITEHSNSRVNINELSKNISKKDITFIPPKEFLSNFKGFRSLWEDYYIHFDKTYYDLTRILDRPLLKDISIIKDMNDRLEYILEGEIIQENGEFYLKRKKDDKLIIVAMLAEGLRKIGTISYLLRNGSLSKNSILIWDEPEANLNPRHTKVVAQLLIDLEKIGIQILIATHSLFLVREIEILREKGNQIKYFGFGFDEDNQLQISNGEELSQLKDVVFLDESLSQSTRYLNKKNG